MFGKQTSVRQEALPLKIEVGSSVAPQYPIQVIIHQSLRSHNYFNLTVEEAKLLRDSLDLQLRKHE